MPGMMAAMDIRALRVWTLRRTWVSKRLTTALFTCTQTHGDTMRHGYVSMIQGIVLDGLINTQGNEWITQHDTIGRAYGKPVVLEEYGAPYAGNGSIETVGGVTANSTLIEYQWQQTVLQKTEIAYDSFWQFASKLLPDGEDDSDIYGLYYATPEYQLLAVDHAHAMDVKPVYGPS